MPKLSSEHSEKDEVEELKWVPLDDVTKLEVGFGHKKRIDEFSTIMHGVI